MTPEQLSEIDKHCKNRDQINWSTSKDERFDIYQALVDDVPDLLSEVRRLQAEVGRLKEAEATVLELSLQLEGLICDSQLHPDDCKEDCPFCATKKALNSKTDRKMWKYLKALEKAVSAGSAFLKMNIEESYPNQDAFVDALAQVDALKETV